MRLKTDSRTKVSLQQLQAILAGQKSHKEVGSQGLTQELGSQTV